MHALRTTPLAVCVVLALFVGEVQAQVTLPVSSSYATVSERVGLTDVTVTYGRPGVNERTIWGELVPYGVTQPFPTFGNGKAFPWRAGANENTTVTFAHDVLIEGQRLPAGTYGLHMIPAESEPWTIAFSRNATSWGSFFYDEAEDALRVEVVPEEAPHKERLQYEFDSHEGADAVTLAMRWERLRVPIRVQVADQHEVVLASLRSELRSRGGFSWQGYFQAANYALQNGVALEEGLAWADKSIQINDNFNNQRLRSGLLAQLGQAEASAAAMEHALAVATENQLNNYGYQMMGQEKMDEAKMAFELNVERHPDSWNVYDSLGEYYAKAGDGKKASKLYKKALAMLAEEDATNRDRINQVLAQLEQ